MTEEEKELLESLGCCWNNFCALNKQHPSDSDDFLFHIHALQRIIMVRLAQRELPGFFKFWPN